MKKLLFIFTLSVSFTACNIDLDNPLEDSGQDIYVIKKGEHDSGSSPKSFSKTILSFQAKFDESAEYQTTRQENQADINKLMGFSDCNGHHHNNSARFGWRWFDNQLEIHAYCYIDGQRVNKYITSVPLNSMNDYQIEIADNKYIFTVNNNARLEINKNNSCSGGINYMLFPYFGGDEPAPHDITVTVNMD